MVRDVQETKLGVIYYGNPYRHTSGNWSCGGGGSEIVVFFQCQCWDGHSSSWTFLVLNPSHIPVPLTKLFASLTAVVKAQSEDQVLES